MAFALGGCAAPEKQNDPNTVYVTCDRDAPTGSNLIKKRCRTEAQREQEAEDAAGTLDSATRGSMQEIMRSGK